MSKRTAGYLSYREQKRFKYKILFIVKLIVLCFIFYNLLTLFLLSSYEVNNVSMEPLLKEENRVLTCPLVYGANIPFSDSRFPGFREPQRGDIVIAQPGNLTPPGILVRLLDPVVSFFTLHNITLHPGVRESGSSPYIIKRIIGVPGDILKIEDFTVYIKERGNTFFLREGEVINDDYDIKYDPLPEGWSQSYPFSSGSDEITLEENEYFILGDNRSSSYDSRHFGPVQKSSIISLVVFRYWPLKSFGVPQ